MQNIKVLTLLVSLFLTSCASYVTPGGSVSINEITDTDIQTMMARQPTAHFPARIAVARIQSSGYRSGSQSSYGYGRYSFIPTREIIQEADFNRLAALDGLVGIAPINQFFLPERLDSIKSLRIAAARLKADILLLYTFQTSFQVGKQQFAPLNVISLGFLNNKKVSVTTTVTSAFFDVRTEYLYAVTEATHTETSHASVWNYDKVVDALRLKTERQSFTKLMPSIEKTWQTIVTEYKVKEG